MGGDNPINQFVDTVNGAINEVVVKPASGFARGIGLGGVADAYEKAHAQEAGLTTKIADVTTGEDKKRKAKADSINDENARKQGIAASEAAKKVAADKFNASEQERMSVGKGARTLLTGPAGLEDSTDDDYSLSRKMLKGS